VRNRRTPFHVLSNQKAVLVEKVAYESEENVEKRQREVLSSLKVEVEPMKKCGGRAGNNW
jgi:hypothetical protein